MNDNLTQVFELSINLFQGMTFVVFCNSFLTPRFKKTVNIILCILTILLLFLSISAINNFFSSIANIEILVYLLIMIPFSVFCHNAKLHLKITMPLIIFVIYMCVSMIFSAFLSVITGNDAQQIITQSSVCRFIYLMIGNTAYFFILYIVQRIYKNKINIKKPVDAFAFIAIPLLTMALILLATAVITDESTSQSGRVYLGIISFIAFIVAFSMFPLMKQISKAAELDALNTLMAKEQEMYKTEISNQKTYVEEISRVKHEMRRTLGFINLLLSEGNINQAQEICRSTDNSLNDITPAFCTDNVYLNTILNNAHKKAIQNGITACFTIKSNLKYTEGNDMLSLLGNLTDNAFEALTSVKENKLIQITVFEKGHYYIISVKNTVAKPVLKENPDLKTTKSDSKSHGHGLKIAKSIVKKYNGTINFSEKEGIFDVSLMLEKPDTE